MKIIKKFLIKMNFNNQSVLKRPLSSYDIKVEKEDKLYRLAFFNNSTDFIEEFNFTVNSILPGILKRKFQCDDGSIRDVKSVKIKFPQFSSGGKKYLLTPFIARMTATSYMCEIWIEFSETSSDGKKLSDKNSFEKIGFFHCVIGSNRDITNVKPAEFKNLDEWKMMLKECPGSPASYIINKGNEKIIIINEILRTNILMTFKTKKDVPIIETRITCMNNSVTTLVKIKIGKKRPTIKVVFPHIKNKHYPLFLTFYILFLSYNSQIDKNFSLNKLEKLIASFFTEKDKYRIIAYLAPSKNKFQELFCRSDKNNDKIEIDQIAVRDYINKKNGFRKEKKEENKNDERNLENQLTFINVINNVTGELFIQCNSSKDKLCNLANMVCQTIRCAIGIRKFDSRDEWANKKGDTYCRMVALYANDLIADIKKKKRDENGLNFNKSERKESIVEARKCDTINAANAEKDKITNGVDSRSTSIVIRSVSEGQLNYIDPAHTPESSTCGLNKYKASLCHLSFNREYIPNRKLAIDDLFEPYIYYFSQERTDIFRYKLIIVDINSRFQGIYHGISEQDCTDNIYVSTRILNIFTELFQNEKASYYIDDDCIYIKILSEINQHIMYNSYVNGLVFYIPIPQELSANFEIAIQKTKNPDYVMCSSFIKNEDCDIILIFRDNGNDHILRNKNFLYVSNYFLNLLSETSNKLNFSEYEQDDQKYCIVHLDGDNEYVLSKIKHWTGVIIKCNIPKIIQTSFTKLLGVINEYFSINKSETYSFTFMFNGIVLTDNEINFYPNIIWNNSKKLYSYLKQKRSSNELPLDSCIYYNDLDFSIQYFDDSGRLMAPMLVVDDNGELKIDELNLWREFDEVNYNQSKVVLNNLYKKRAIELIDVKEMDTTLIAEDINECRTIFNLKKFLNSVDLKEIKNSIVHCKNTQGEEYFNNEDINSIKILGNKFEIEFTKTRCNDFETLSFTQDNITYYGTYVIKKKIYTKIQKRIYRLEKPNNAIKKDTFYIAYIKDAEVFFITTDNDLCTDGEYVFSEDEPDIKYKLHFIDFKKKNELYVDEDFTVINCNYFTRVQNDNRIIYLYKEKINNNKKIDVDDNSNYRFNIVNPNYIINNNFLEVNREFKIVDEIHFPEDEYECFFENKSVDIHEYINIDNTDYTSFNLDFENSEQLDIREANLYLSMIRRHIDDIQKINFNDYVDDLEVQFNILQSLKEHISYFGNKKIINIIRRYLTNDFKFTHCLIDPGSAYSVVANFVPKADSNPGPRFSYQCSMATQALGVGNCVWYCRYETSIKRLISPTEHGFETVTELPLNQVTMPVTQNFVFLNDINYKGFEDPIILSKEALEKFGRYEKESVIKINESNGNKDFTEKICFPFDKFGNLKSGHIYRHLDENGLPMLGSRIRIGDCIIGRNKVYHINGEIKRTDSSFIAGIDNEGIITSVQIIGSEGSSSQFKTIYIKLAQRRKQQVGDKMAARYSQKGTIGDIIGGIINDGDERLRIVDDCLMPYVIGGPNDRMRVEIIFNPASYPSRMTCGLVKEILCSKSALYLQEKVDASNFHPLDMNYYRQALYENKLFEGTNDHLDINSSEFMCHSDGEIIMDYSTGKPMKFYIGIVAYQFLKHHVEDKKTARATGAVKSITHQPEEGRGVGGGLRFGEMERDTLISSGASGTLHERFYISSDGYVDVYCTNCKNNSAISILNSKTCKICGVSGCLVSVENTRISVVFNHQMNALGLEIKETLIPDEF